MENPTNFDIIAHNGEEIVIIEVNAALRVGLVDKFIKQLHRAKRYMSEYGSHTVLSAVACLHAEKASDQYMQNRRIKGYS